MAQGQVFGPEAVGGALLGSLLGGIAGSHGHGLSGRGAAIGAGVGLVAGAVVGEAQRQSYYASQPSYCPPAPCAQPGCGYVYQPAMAYGPAARPNYAVSGTLLGALAGGLVGSAEHRGWEGADIGAASGLVLGSVTEAAAEHREQKTAQAQRAPPPSRAVGRPVQPAAVAVWAPARQIPDAPRVPDAPTFK